MRSIIILLTLLSFHCEADMLSLNFLRECKYVEVKSERKREVNSVFFSDRAFRDEAEIFLAVWSQSYCSCFAYQTVAFLKRYNKSLPDYLEYRATESKLKKSAEGRDLLNYCYQSSITNSRTAFTK